MEWTVKRTGIFKKMIMHVKEMCRIVTIEYSPRMFTIKAVAMFNQSYTEVCMPASFFKSTRVFDTGSVNMDITHLYHVLKSCACTDTIVLRLDRSIPSARSDTDMRLTVVFVREQRCQTFVIACHHNDRDCSLRPHDSPTAATVSSKLLCATFERIQDLVDAVDLHVGCCADEDVLYVSGSGDVAEILCMMPTRILCSESNPTGTIGTYDLSTLCSAAYFASMSISGYTQLHCSSKYPLKLLFTVDGECYVTIMIASLRPRRPTNCPIDCPIDCPI